jgi:hypothetical protein
LGLRLLLWLLARKVKKLVKELEKNGGQMGGPGWQVQTFGFGLPQSPQEPQILDAPALSLGGAAVSPQTPPASGVERSLLDRFLERTSLSPAEWEQVKDRLVFVTDNLTREELEEMGFVPGDQGNPREQVQGQSQLLGSLEDADVYIAPEMGVKG